uniref:uncharacterized protein LOC113475699 n=1 Tax=Ciona intestinalis TaxID=7719 RepID=UPI000EF52219|nr:uncharacterized protein LOC113475699 [Ciona intestinalis]|eukprot:XP_026696066.1 uncharacterized protein LOC113475699 [Ciona intestinalis]
MRTLVFLNLVILSAVPMQSQGNQLEHPLKTSGLWTQTNHYSSNPESEIIVPYQFCLSSEPICVKATATPTVQHSGYNFTTRVKDYGLTFLLVEVTRTDENAGWSGVDFKIEWSIYTGSGAFYQGHLIWLPVRTDGSYRDKKTAETECSNAGDGYLVDLENEDMYDVVYDYVSRTYVSSSNFNHVSVWLGSTYDVVTHTVTKSDGTPGYYGSWKNGGLFPSNVTAMTHMYIKVGIGSDPATTVGISNTWANIRVLPLCSKTI